MSSNTDSPGSSNTTGATLRIVKVHWRDAEHIINDTWTDEAKVQEFADEDFVLESIGYLVRKTDKYVTLAGDWDEYNKNWGAVRKIPSAMVLSIEDLGH